jgi:hypothetical protein
MYHLQNRTQLNQTNGQVFPNEQKWLRALPFQADQQLGSERTSLRACRSDEFRYSLLEAAVGTTTTKVPTTERTTRITGGRPSTP